MKPILLKALWFAGVTLLGVAFYALLWLTLALGDPYVAGYSIGK